MYDDRGPYDFASQARRAQDLSDNPPARPARTGAGSPPYSTPRASIGQMSTTVSPRTQ